MEWSRRGLLALVLACAFGAFGAMAANAGAAPSASRAVDLRRAELSYAAMVKSFRTGRRFAETSLRTDAAAPAAFAWPASQAVAASLALARIRGAASAYGRDARAGLEALDGYWQDGALAGYASSPPTGGAPAGPEYYDDNEWIAFDLLGAYALTRGSRRLARARELFELVVSGWGADAARCPGGVYWMRSQVNRDRNAVTTENGALLALQLYSLTRQPHYLRWAIEMYRWSERCLSRPDGLLADHIAADGTTDERAWSYNQGAAIAAGVLLARATGDVRLLDVAARRAHRALRHFGTFTGEPRIFVAIFFRDLALLDAVRPRSEYRRALARYAGEAWRTARDAGSGLFGGGGVTTLLDQAAMVQIFTLLASGRRSDVFESHGTGTGRRSAGARSGRSVASWPSPQNSTRTTP